MMYPFTPTAYLATGIIFAVISLFMFLSSREKGNGTVRDVALMFLFLAGYSFSLSLPFYFNPSNLEFIAKGYALGMVFVFLVMLVGVRVQLFIAGKSSRPAGFPPAALISLAGFYVLYLLLSDLRLPIIDPAGVIVWNANYASGALAGGVTLLYGIVWAYYFLKAAAVVGKLTHKIKMFSLGVAGLVFGALGYFKFTAETAEASALALQVFLATTAILALILLVLRFFDPNNK